MPPKTKEVMVALNDDPSFREAIKEGAVFMEVYSENWGRCVCFKASVQKLYFAYMDCIKFHAAKVEDIKALQAEGFECIEPVFLFYKDGKRLKTIQGCNGPDIENTLKEIKDAVAAA